MARPLDFGGIILALIMGVVITYFGGWNYLLLMLTFFSIAVIVTGYEHLSKRDMGIYEHERGWENVLSNGLLPTILAVASGIIGPMPYIACIGAVAADKFASELGVLGGKPIDLATFKEAKPGTSGAVTVMGFIVSLAGGTVIGVAAMFLFDLNATQALLIGGISLVGSIVDSLFGILEERGIGTKGTTNFICSLFGAILGYFLVK